MSRVSDWRLALRLARRDALNARGRSILVLVMIALPVLGVTAADVVIHTQDVDSFESVSRRLGAAEAQVVVDPGAGRVVQGADPESSSFSTGEGVDQDLTREGVTAELGDTRLLELRRAGISFPSDQGVAEAEALEVDLADPLTDGLVDLVTGRVPEARDEVVVNQAFADKGYAVGDPVELTAGDPTVPTEVEIVGIAESTTVRDYPTVTGPLGSLGIDNGGARTWLVGGDPVTFAQVRELNDLGATVLSRAVLLDPPAASELDPALGEQPTGPGEDTIASVVLIVVMALIEVVLLAGPAFAVGARRQSRSLALMTAAGGTPRQSRRVVLAGGVVLGGVASGLGVVLGIALGWAVLPVVQGFSRAWFGPFEVPWLQVLGVGLFGLVSALLAAVVPAVVASRQDVVAVLAGRRGDRRPSLRSPLLGLVLLGVGVAGAAVGANGRSGVTEYLIAGSAIVSVLGMVLLVPVVVVALARLSRRLPLTLRYAVRDASRHRSRTVPAVAAVAATVAGVVALSIAVSSDEAQNEATYQATLPAGMGLVQAYESDADWDAYRAAVTARIPDATVTEVRGLRSSADSDYLEVTTSAPGEGQILGAYDSSLGSDVLVSDEGLPPGLLDVPRAAAADAARTLAAGGVVAFTDRGVESDTVRLRIQIFDAMGETTDRPRTGTFPATVIRRSSMAGPQAVVSSAAAEALGIEPSTVSLVVGDTDIGTDQQGDVTEALAALSPGNDFVVERGYQPSDEIQVIQLVLGALGGILMLGGTLTATFLALSDARSDLATLSAVGATPRTRRRVAAAYALVVGFVGAALGALVGAIPGVAISYPLTSGGFVPSGTDVADHYLDVPWLLVGGLVVALPLLTALVVGVSARSRLPLASRLE